MEPAIQKKLGENEKLEITVRWEIDSSAPFESVMAAVEKFGGYGNWKRSQFNLSHSQKGAEQTNVAQGEDGGEETNVAQVEDGAEETNVAKVEDGREETNVAEVEDGAEEVDVTQMEEQIALPRKNLMAKERETFDVLRELDATKTMARELKTKLEKQETEINTVSMSFSSDKIVSLPFVEENKENHENGDSQNLIGDFSPCTSTLNPSLVLAEPKQDKLNLSGISKTRASAELLKKELDEEKASLEKTLERQALNISKTSSLEEALNQMKLKLQQAKDIGNDASGEQLNFKGLNALMEKFKKLEKAAKDEGLRASTEIEQTNAKISHEEIIQVATRKIKEKGRAADGISLASEEYSSLTHKAHEAEEHSGKKVLDAMSQVDLVIDSKMQILKRVEKVTEKFNTNKKVQGEGLIKVKAANKGKMAAEEALPNCRSEYSAQILTRFIYVSSSSSHRGDPRLLKANGLNIVCNEAITPALEPTLSIVREEFETKMLGEKGLVKRKISDGGQKKRVAPILTRFKNASSFYSHKGIPCLLDVKGLKIICYDATAPSMEPTLSIVPDYFERKKPEEKGHTKGKMSWAKSWVRKMATLHWMKEKAERE